LSPKTTRKSLSALVDATLPPDECGKRLGRRFVLHRISQHARPFTSGSLVDFLTISGGENDDGKRLVG
jgi:hypothetical protein